MKISACIITFNEEKNISAAIESVDCADEILIVDSESTDGTKEIAESLGARVLTQKWLGFSKQKQMAVDYARYDWILSLDADEQISPELRDEISKLKLLPENAVADGYEIARLSFYMNRPIRHGGWYPNRQLRLFNRNKGFWKDVLVHESVEMQKEAKIRKLDGDIFHYSIKNAAHHHNIIGERYAPLAARQMFERGILTTPFKIMTAGFTTFLQTYILKLGFLDGLAGFCIARFAAHHAFLKNLLLWEMQCENLRSEIQRPKS